MKPGSIELNDDEIICGACDAIFSITCPNCESDRTTAALAVMKERDELRDILQIIWDTDVRARKRGGSRYIYTGFGNRIEAALKRNQIPISSRCDGGDSTVLVRDVRINVDAELATDVVSSVKQIAKTIEPCCPHPKSSHDMMGCAECACDR